MKLKSYFSGTVEAAMQLARQELGEEALLMNTRAATPETRYLGAYEVVFGIPARHIALATPPAAGASGQGRPGHGGFGRTGSTGQSGSTEDRWMQEVAGLRRDMERMLNAVLEGRSGASSQQLSAPAAGNAAPDPPPLCEVDATLGRPAAGRAIIALVGPPGVGKTTTLIKLAARYGLTSRKPSQIISTDVYRIAAADQLRTLAAILGIGCGIAETAGALAQMLEEHRSKELIFVDTPNLACADIDDAADLAHLIASHQEIDTHLVLPAFMRPSDMERIITEYRVFAPRKLIFTHIDETGSHADMVRVAARTRLPVSFLANGQRIPDDLEPAGRDRLAEWLGADSPSEDTARGDASRAGASSDASRRDAVRIKGAAA
jgi:flagellar biosynthesis protein FlhF